MNTFQVVFDTLQITINLAVIWYIHRLHQKIGKLSGSHRAMGVSLDERTLNQAEYDAMADEQKDANQADYKRQKKDSAES